MAGVETVVKIAVATFIIAILGAIFVMIGPTLQGVGAQTAGAMGTNLTAYYNATNTSAVNAATGYGSANLITPFLAIAFGLLTVLGISLAGYFHMGRGKRRYKR